MKRGTLPPCDEASSHRIFVSASLSCRACRSPGQSALTARLSLRLAAKLLNLSLESFVLAHLALQKPSCDVSLLSKPSSGKQVHICCLIVAIPKIYRLDPSLVD